MDMGAKGIAPWLRNSGFPAPITGTPVTHIVYGSGDLAVATSFQPKVFALYDATV
jgi:hypothetical protein